jgi:hypothetical protein
MKIKGEKGIQKTRMPAQRPPLEKSDIQLIETWIKTLGGALPPQAGQPESGGKRRNPPEFEALQLINLPTAAMTPRKSFLFRVSHHFYSSIKGGYPVFYGLDGPAAIFLSFGYGLSDRLNLTLGRSNRYQEFELSLKWLLLEQDGEKGLPISAALSLGGVVATESRPGVQAFDSENWKWNLQLSVSWQVTDRLSLLLVPAYSTNTNHLSPDAEGTLALGGGLHLNIFEDFSLIGEWLPILSGHKNRYNGWSLGVEKKIGWHVFQVYASNTVGITSDQFVQGGDLRLGDGDLRFGFTIFRRF